MRCSWKKTYDKPRQYIKQQKHHFVNKGLYRQSYGFSNSHVWMESWTIRKAECQRIDAFKVVLEKTLERESLGLQGDQTSQS